MNRSEAARWLVLVLIASLGSQTGRAAKKTTLEAEQHPLTPSIVDGNPALQIVSNGWSTYISVVEYKGDTAFKFPVSHFGGGDGYLYVTKARLTWDPALSTGHGDQALDVSANGVTNKGKFGCDLKINDKLYSFMALFQRGEERDRFPKGVSENDIIKGTVASSFRHWCDVSLTDFSAALQEFHRQVGDAIWANSPEVKAKQLAAQQAFEQQVAAWRANGSKVDPPEEAQRHFAIAQEAFREKNFQHQAEEMSAALEIYPTWPAEQYDLAVILGELNRYSEAVQHMQMYLELTPDAPDAQKAKQQIWIWQDKMTQKASAQTSQ